MVTEIDIRLADRRTLHAYDTRADGNGSSPGTPGSPAVVFWLHGSPNVGSPPERLFAAAEANDLRWVSYDRPGYGGSSACEGRTTASAAGDVAAVGIAAENRAAAGGRAALEDHWATAQPEDMGAFFTEADIAALDGTWSWLAGVAGQAMEQGNEGLAEDTLAAVRPWGFRPDAIRIPVLIMHGAKPGSPPASVREPAGRGRGIKSPQFV